MRNITDNERYAALQRDYFAARETDKAKADNALTAMHLLMVRYQIRQIRKYCKTKGVWKSEDEIESDAEDMAAWVTAMYLTRPEWKGVKQMSAYCHNAFVKVLFDKKRIARETAEREIREASPYTLTGFGQDWIETEDEKRGRALSERIAPGIVQMCLPFEEFWEDEK